MLDHCTKYISFLFQKQDTGHVLLELAYNHLGLLEKEYFGLQHCEDSDDSPVRKPINIYKCTLKKIAIRKLI